MNDGVMQKSSMNIDIAFALAAVVGVTLGVILSINLDEDMLIRLSGTQEKLALAANGSRLGIIAGSFAGVGMLLGLAFLCGFSAVSQPIELLIVAFRGLGLGVCVRGIYLGEGVLRSMAVFLPFAVLSTGILILGSKEAFGLSMRYLGLSSTTENRLGIKTEIHDYIIKFILLTLLLTVLAAADAFLAGYVSRL